jgi:hypothetical protein
MTASQTSRPGRSLYKIEVENLETVGDEVSNHRLPSFAAPPGYGDAHQTKPATSWGV